MKRARSARDQPERERQRRDNSVAPPRTGGKSFFNEVNDIENGFARSAGYSNVVAVGEPVKCGHCPWPGEIGGEGMNFGTGFLQLMSRLELLLRRLLVCGSRRSRDGERTCWSDI